MLKPEIFYVHIFHFIPLVATSLCDHDQWLQNWPNVQNFWPKKLDSINQLSFKTHFISRIFEANEQKNSHTSKHVEKLLYLFGASTKASRSSKKDSKPQNL